MKTPTLLLPLFLLALLALPYQSMANENSPLTWSTVETEVKKDVPYVPTPDQVVDEMLSMANVTGNDVLYDLGCGDGRIVVTAARKFGAKGVGIDIDPQRIKECKENAAAAGVDGKVRFLQQDLFTTDIKDATVVTMYLLSSVNLKLRPRLLSDLKPGTRIVSHSFDMGDWKPDKTSTASHPVYFWVIPANLSGTWKWSTANGNYTFTIRQRFQEAAGTLSAGANSADLYNFVIWGDSVRFDVDLLKEGKVVPMTFNGRAAGNRLVGQMKERSKGGESLECKATRDPATMKPLDGQGFAASAEPL